MLSRRKILNTSNDLPSSQRPNAHGTEFNNEIEKKISRRKNVQNLNDNFCERIKKHTQ